MSVEPKLWNLGTRRSGKLKSGGIHVYVNADVLRFSVETTKISLNSDLLVKAYALKGTKNKAKILLVFKEKDGVNKKE